ncbi:MAG: fluoride efflux transporter CrcB [Ginsengibacter sp.]
MRLILLIGFGSFIGGVSRYLVTLFIQNKYLSSFPFGTMAVNIIGCFLIGLVYGLSDKGTFNAEWRIFLATGILGGFTTFSSFSHETITLLREEHYLYAFANVGLSIILGLTATIAGILLIKNI